METQRVKTESGLLIHGDCRDAMAGLLEEYRGKVKLICTDPPYNAGVISPEYEDSFPDGSYITMMETCLRLARELLSENGFLFLQIGGPKTYTMKALLDRVFGEACFRNEIILTRTDSRRYYKGNRGLPSGYDSLFMYSKEPDAEVPEPSQFLTDNWTDLDIRGRATAFDHEQNEKIPARIIHWMTAPGDIVLDPFLGSGTTAAAALRAGRRWIGIEKENFCMTETFRRIRNAETDNLSQSFRISPTGQ